jgi:Adenylate and Guanylate cyclase catalytic domain
MPSDPEATASIQNWLLTEGRHSESFEKLLRKFTRRVRNAGYPVDRLFVATAVLHPLAAAVHCKWEHGCSGGGGTDRRRCDDNDGGVSHCRCSTNDTSNIEASCDHHAHDENKDRYMEVALNFRSLMKPDFDYNAVGGIPPFAQFVHYKASQVRIRVGEPHDDPIPHDCQWLVEEDYTDYIALPDYGKDQSFEGAVAWSTKCQRGFVPRDIHFFQSILPSLAIVLRLLSNTRMTRNLLTTYLGRDAGLRVQAGSLNRGDGRHLPAAIWFSDVRGFTALSNHMPLQTVITMLNSVFEVSEAVVRSYGGEDLKLMGDGMSKFWPAILNGVMCS